MDDVADGTNDDDDDKDHNNEDENKKKKKNPMKVEFSGPYPESRADVYARAKRRELLIDTNTDSCAIRMGTRDLQEEL